MDKKKILILCVHNSARSQLAEAIFRYFGNGGFEVKSAGINPHKVHPLVFKVLDECGIDATGLYSKSVSEFINQKFDYVITVCDSASQTCPTFFGDYKKIHFPIKDPALETDTEEKLIFAFRDTRNIIKSLAIKFFDISLDEARIKCPFCSFIEELKIPKNMCLTFYRCINCKNLISTPPPNCCVICAFSDKVCKEFYETTIKKYRTSQI